MKELGLTVVITDGTGEIFMSTFEIMAFFLRQTPCMISTCIVWLDADCLGKVSDCPDKVAFIELNLPSIEVGSDMF